MPFSWSKALVNRVSARPSRPPWNTLTMRATPTGVPVVTPGGARSVGSKDSTVKVEVVCTAPP
jgi:hypothetical protein